MTEQITDRFFYNGERYALIEIDGENLIIPQTYGIEPKMWNTACADGFYSTYEITNNGLFLIKMTIGHVDGDWKPIQGVMPTPDEDRAFGGFSYKGLNIFTKFTGRILLGKDFIQIPNFYDPMAYRYAISFQTLFEFTFAAGKLVSIQDLSAENAQNRSAFKQRFNTQDTV